MAAPPPAPVLDPNELGRREFSRVRRGWDPVEVRAHLLQMADELKRLQNVETSLRAKLERFEVEESEPEELDEAKLTRLLGEETARVLEAARTAAAEIRTKAEENAARLVREALEEATRLTRDADELRLAASRESDEVLAAARTKAEELVREAAEAAETARTEAEAEAAAVRERAGKAAAELRSEAEDEAERLRSAAQTTKAEAEEHAARVRREADEQATQLRTAAEALAEELRSDAETAAERIRTEASEAAKHRAEEAERSAEAEIEIAREQGRTMVTEAREARERMLRDLAERRKVARQQLEALRAGRERLLDSFRSVRSAFDDATDELVEALPAARAAADDAARAVDDDIDAAIAELDAAIAGALPSEAADHPSADAGPARPEPVEDNAAEEPTTDSVAPEPGDEADRDAEPATSRLRLVPGGHRDDDLDEDDDLDDEEAADHAGESGSVEEIFARLRAGQSDDDESTPTDGPGAVIITLEADRVGDDVVTEIEVVEVDVEPAGDDGVEDDTPTSRVTALLDRRDDLLGPVERSFGRTLKRVLSDQENAVLAAVRRSRKAKTADELLGATDERAAALVDPVVAELTGAVAAGGRFIDDDAHDAERVDADAEASALGAQVREWVADPLRDRLERALADADLAGDRSELVDRLRAVYRELKNDRLAELSGDLLTLAFNRGVLASAETGTEHVWIVDHGGLPCPEGEDNHLAGPVAAGEAFPTGALHPPAQAGCRCLLAPPPR
jgi:hypothetical protein